MDNFAFSVVVFGLRKIDSKWSVVYLPFPRFISQSDLAGSSPPGELDRTELTL